MRSLRHLAGAALARAASVVAGRRYQAVAPLPRSLAKDGGADDPLLPVRYTYRATSDGTVTYRFLSDADGGAYALHPMAFNGTRPVAGPTVFASTLPAITRGDRLVVNLSAPSIALNGRTLQCGPVRPGNARKFIAEIQTVSGRRRSRRLCSHYLPFEGKAIGSEYYFGDDYVDYTRQVAVPRCVSLVRRHCSSGRLLDVGCALGLYTAGFRDAGFDAYGLDASAFAVAEAARRLNPERVRCVNLDRDEIPFPGWFDVLFLWDVLEHFAQPRIALAKVSARARPGTWLFLHTSNSDSLAHRIFGGDWEGYTDYSHLGVDQVTCASLRSWLEELGWELTLFSCYDVWTFGADPVVRRLATLNQTCPEIETLLHERELGDFIEIVARRRSP
jgi:hypothetical protein